MKLLQFVQEKFWITPLIGLLLGLTFPSLGQKLSGVIVPAVMIMFFSTCLKIDFIEVLSHIKKPLFLFYLSIMYLLVIPAILYGMFQFVNPELALAILLLASICPGASAPVLTDIFKGNTTLSMAISLITYVASPFTVVLLFLIFTQRVITIDLYSLFKSLLLINVLPLLAAQLIRKTFKDFVERTKKHYSLVNIFLIGFIIYIVVAIQANEILQNPLNTFVNIVWLYLLFFILFIAGYFIAFWRKRSDKIAIAITKTYMNNTVTIAMALTFFGPKIALLMVLSEVPWGTTLGLFKYLLKYLP